MKMHADPRILQRIEDFLRIDGVDKVDAGEVFFVAKDLEHVKAETYDIEYPQLKAVRLIPIDTSVEAGAETFSYKSYNMFGKAAWISDYSKDFPMTDAFLKRYVFPTDGIGVGYQYTLQDLRKSAMSKTGKSLDVARGDAARLAHAQFEDDVACFGDTARGLKGFINHSDIPTVSPAFGSWDTLDTSDASNTKIAADLTKLVMAPEIATIGLHVADTLLLPLSMKTRLMYPTSTYVKQPLINNWLENFQEGPNGRKLTVEWWNRLDAAFSRGPGVLGALNYTANEALGMAYENNKRILYYVIPLPFTQHAPQQEKLAFVVPCESRTGGVCIPYPLACARMNFHS